MRGAITLLIVGAVIVTLGSSAVFVSALRRRVRERFLLWFGLFSTESPLSSGIPPFVWASDNRRVSDFLLSGS